MDERYSRNVPALTEEECAALRQKRVCVVGCGGLGGFIIEFLSRVGIGYIRCVDGDVFDKTNLNRQILSTVNTLGISKAQAAKERIAAVNPDVEASAVCEFLTEDNARTIIENCDVVFDALDNIDARRILAKACESTEVPYIYGAIGGWVAQAAISMPGDGLIEMLYPPGTEIKNKSVLSFTPAFCASMQAALGVKLLVGRKVETGKIYYFDLLNQEFETISRV